MARKHNFRTPLNCCDIHFRLKDFGYVKRPMKLAEHPSEAEVMVTTHVPTLAGEQLKEQLKKKEFVILERFERNGKFVHLYIRN